MVEIACLAQVTFSDVFSTRKPKDFKAGVASGLKSMSKGIVAGAVGLVAAPIMGARQEGVKGCAKGMAAGIVGAVALPVAGVTVGTAQGMFDRRRQCRVGGGRTHAAASSDLACPLHRCPPDGGNATHSSIGAATLLAMMLM